MKRHDARQRRAEEVLTRATRTLLALPAVLALRACMEGDRVIWVNADGSGAIADTMKLGERARTVIESMDAAASKRIKGAQASPEPDVTIELTELDVRAARGSADGTRLG